MLACAGTSKNEIKLTLSSPLQLEWGYYWLFDGYVSWVLTNAMTESSHFFQKCDRNLRKQIFCIMVCLNFWADYQIFIYSYHQEMMKSMGSHGSLSLQFMMKVMVWHFVSECHKFLTTLIVPLPVKSCSGDFSANLTDVVFLFLSSCDLLLWSVVIWSTKLITK